METLVAGRDVRHGPRATNETVNVRKKKHWAERLATVPCGEYTVPLLGVPKSATQEKCSQCGAPLHLTDTVLNAKGEPCCKTCCPA